MATLQRTMHSYAPDFFTGYQDDVPLSCRYCGEPERHSIHHSIHGYNIVHPDTQPLPYEVKEKHDMNPDGPCSCLQHRTENCTECFDGVYRDAPDVSLNMRPNKPVAGPESRPVHAYKPPPFDVADSSCRAIVKKGERFERCFEDESSAVHKNLGQLMPALVDEDAMAPHDKTWMLDGSYRTTSPGPKVSTETDGPVGRAWRRDKLRELLREVAISVQKVEKFVNETL